MNERAEDAWAEVSDAARRMFNVWDGVGELDWAREAWGHLYEAGLISDEGPVEITATNLRLVTLALVYEEFCDAAWDEYVGSGASTLSEELVIDSVALGALAAQADKDFFREAFDESELHEAALMAVSNIQREEIYRCLKSACGGDVGLYARLHQTHPRSNGTVGMGDEFGDDCFDVTGANMDALMFVENGFNLG